MARQLSEIYIYPIKSLGGVRLTEAELTERGLAYDRRWMLVGEEGFLTQRTVPQMALLRITLHDDHFKVHRSDQSPLTVPFVSDPDLPITTVRVWDDLATGQLVSEEANRWFSEALGVPCTLFYMPERSPRVTTGKVSGRQQAVSFADGYPALLIGQASLDDLNARLAHPVPMNRFRPNLVFTGGEPYEEDEWYAFTIGGVSAWAEKPCARCTVVTIDQQTAESGKEPLVTLTKYRRQGNKVLFGQNILYEAGATILVGDAIRVATHKPEFS